MTIESDPGLVYTVEASEIVDAVRLVLRFYGEKGKFPSYPIYTK